MTTQHTPDFDELPMMRQPNPLSCGCAIMGVPGINLEGTRTETRNLHIQYCSRHSAALDLLAALKETTRQLESATSMLNSLGYPIYWHDAIPTLSQARAAIAKAEAQP